MDENNSSSGADQETQEWADAEQNFAEENNYKLPEGTDSDGKPSGVKSNEEPKKDEPAKPKEESQKKEEENPNPENKKSDEEPKSGDDSEKKDGDSNEPGDESKQPVENKPKEDEPKEEPQPAAESDPIRDARTTQRQLAEEEKAVKADIREQLFSEVKPELTDADGDPIRTIADVQRLINPNTKKPFTEEEAGMWLLQAQDHLNKQNQEIEQKIEKIAEVNLSIKDQADNIRSKYGELLKANPNGIADKILTAYMKTLVRDKETDIITDAPVSMEEFYEAALAPYVKLAEKLEADATKEEEEAEKKKKQEQEAKKNQNRSDRSDVFSSGKSDTMDPEEKEWATAAKKVFG